MNYGYICDPGLNPINAFNAAWVSGSCIGVDDFAFKKRHTYGTLNRFHLHQNLLEAVKNTVNATVPVDIKIPADDQSPSVPAALDTAASSKKMARSVDNFKEYNPKSVQLYNNIQEYAEAGYSKREIAKIMHCGRNTVSKYLNSDYESLCRKVTKKFIH